MFTFLLLCFVSKNEQPLGEEWDFTKSNYVPK